MPVVDYSETDWAITAGFTGLGLFPAKPAAGAMEEVLAAIPIAQSDEVGR
jgi:hypothetical protein